MLPKKERLSAAEVRKIGRGRVFNSPNFSARHSASPKPAFAVSISSKVAKKATDRNLLRRRVFEAVESFLKKKPVSSRVVFFARAGAPKLSFSEIFAEISGILESISAAK